MKYVVISSSNFCAYWVTVTYFSRFSDFGNLVISSFAVSWSVDIIDNDLQTQETVFDMTILCPQHEGSTRGI